MIVILKFFFNDKRPELDTVISRTLMKVALVSRNYTALGKTLPQNGELWKCRVVKEMNGGEPKGCFIVDPIEKVEFEKDVRMLYDGSFTYEVVSNRIWVKPNKSGLWMIDLMLKEMLAERHKAYCVIVDLENRPSEEGETIPVAGSSTKVTP